MRVRAFRVISLFLAVMMLGLTVLPASAATSATAATIQLVKSTGTVNISSSSGRGLTQWDNMRLYNGYHVETQAKSYAWLKLDDKKLAKVDAASKVEVRQSGRKLELLLKSGNIFFNVTDPLEDDEVLNVRTSTMVVGIRGTSGFIRVVDRWSTEIYVLEGAVQCNATDPVTGQTKTATVQSGEVAIATAYPQDREGDKCDIIQERFEPEDIDGFVLTELAQDPGLCGDIYEASGMDVLNSMGLLESIRRQLEAIREELEGVREQFERGNLSAADVQAKLDELRQRLEELKALLGQAEPDVGVQQRLDEAQEHLRRAQEALDNARTPEALDCLDDALEHLEGARQDQAVSAQQRAEETAQERLEQDAQGLQDGLDSIMEELSEQNSDVSSETVWGPEAPGPGPSDAPGGDNPGGDNPGGTEDQTGLTRELSTWTSAQDVQNSLNEAGVKTVILMVNEEDPSQNTLTADIELTVGEGQTLILSDGISVVIADNGSLTIKGTVKDEGAASLANNNELIVFGSATLNVQNIVNNGTLMNFEGGKIVTENLTTYGEFASEGTIAGRVTIESGDAEITGGTVTSITQNGGTAMITDGTVENGYVFNGTDGGMSLNMEGGTIEAGGAGAAALAASGSGTITITGGTINGGGRPAVSASGFVNITLGEIGDEVDITGSNSAVLKSSDRDGLLRFSGSGVLRYAAAKADLSGWEYREITGSGLLSTVPLGDGSYRLANASNDIGDILSGAQAGEIIMLPGDRAAGGYMITVPDGTATNPVVLDLNGHTLSLPQGIRIDGALRICDSGKMGGGKLELSAGTIEVSSGKQLFLAGGTVSGGGSNYAVSVGSGGTFTMTGGTVDGGSSVAVYFAEAAGFTISGGEITSSAPFPSGNDDGATILFRADPDLAFHGGTITNRGGGYVLLFGFELVSEDAVTVNSVVRSKGTQLFAHTESGAVQTWNPSKYAVTETPDDEGYYYLTDTEGNIIGRSGYARAAGLFALSAARAAAPASSGPFMDVPDTAWYSDAVQYVYGRGLMSGTGGGAFSPGKPASRATLVTILHRMEGLPPSSGAAFPDVPAGQWYADAVAWASENGIVLGYGSGDFGPNDPVTREQMVAILYRYAVYKGYDTAILGDASDFSDGDSVSPYAADAVNWAIGAGLLQGTGGNTLAPEGGANRAQAAAILTRFCEDIAHSYILTVVSAMDVMCEPRGILFLEDGSFLVTDTFNKVIWLVEDDSSTVYAGSDTVTDPYDRPIGGYNDASLEEAHFRLPWAIVPFLGGYAISDADNNVVRLILAETIQTVNGSTEEDLTVTDLGVVFDHPTGLASDEEGNLYVSCTFEGAVRKISPDGNVTTFADGLSDPMGLCWKNGTLYIAETGANRIVKTSGGQITVVAGSGEDGFADGPAAHADFSAPQGVVVSEDGTIYVSDTANSAVRQIKNGVVTTLIYREEGDLTTFIPTSPTGMTVYGDQLYVCDSFARKVFIIYLGL